MFNSAFEKLARAITNDHDPEIRDALDIASGAVLLASLGAAAVGAMILLPRLLAMFG
jgi:diacylglycerol kinase